MSEDDGSNAGAQDEEEEEERKWFAAESAKTGRASCKRCKEKIEHGTLRIAKLINNPFGAGTMSNWHHPKCFFDSFQKAKATTRRLTCPEDELDGWDTLAEEHKEQIIEFLGDQRVAPKDTFEGLAAPVRRPPPSNPDHKDHAFREFRRICAEISNTSAYLEKTAIVKRVLEKGTNGDGFKGDIYLLFRMLLPMAVKRVYNLHNKQLIKLFSKIFGCSVDDMLEHLELGDVSETVREFFENSSRCPPSKKSKLTLQEVDEWLEDLSKLTREEDQSHHISQIVKKSTSNDLKIIVRLIMHDLKTSAGPKHILEALHPDAYKAFQTSRDLDAVIEKVLTGESCGKMPSSSSDPKISLGIEIKLLTPVLPMLAEACRSVEYAMKKCPNGIFSEIKYDGERVQVHKKGNEFKYFSRSLKPVLPHKVAHFKEYIPKAFPHGKDIILDSEVLLIDTDNGKPLPFGTLGIHKKTAFKNASVCLFVFDCLFYNGKSLLNEPVVERRKFLLENMNEIPNHIVVSEVQEVNKPKDLEAMINRVLKQGLEGLVLKDLKSTYEPGKRHWLKIKKDYLKDGAMADSADLIVLGAWFGSGSKGGMMSIFLMGCWDPKRCKFCTVTKVHGGHDDKTLERLQTELKMIKISKDQSRVPDWLICTKTMIPDFVSKDPKESPVWEITGAEFTQHEVHTADGISVRFPRVSAIRSDKTWKEATSLPELQELYRKSKELSDFTGLGGDENEDDRVKSEANDDHVDNEENENAGEYDDGCDLLEGGQSTPPKEESKGKESLKQNKKHARDDAEVGGGESRGKKRKRNEGEEKEGLVKKRKRNDGEEKELLVKKRNDGEEKEVLVKKRNEGEEKEVLVKKRNEGEDKEGLVKKRKRNEGEEEEVLVKKRNEGEKKEGLVKKRNEGEDKEGLVSDGDPKKGSGKRKWDEGESKNSDVSLHCNENEGSLSMPKKPLPCIFKGIKLIIPHEVKNYDALERYFVGFGGILLDESESKQATHIIYSEESILKNLELSPNAMVIQSSWILHSAKLKELQDINKYKVKNESLVKKSLSV